MDLALLTTILRKKGVANFEDMPSEETRDVSNTRRIEETRDVSNTRRIEETRDGDYIVTHEYSGDVLVSIKRIYAPGDGKWDGKTIVKAGLAISGIVLFLYILSLIIGIYAFYLSWRCNTAEGTTGLLRIVYACLAFVFGLYYIAFYLIVRSGTCSALLKQLKRSSRSRN